MAPAVEVGCCEINPSQIHTSFVLLQEGNEELSAGNGYHTKQRRKESRRQEQGELLKRERMVLQLLKKKKKI